MAYKRSGGGYTPYTSLFYFEFGYYILHAGSCILLYKINKQKSAYGISLDSQIALLIATLARCVWFNDTQLPSMWMAWIEIVMAIVLHSVIVYLCVSYTDILQQKIPIALRWYVFVSIAAALSLVFYPGKAGKYYLTQQMFVSLTMFIEALSLVSQLYHMHIGNALEGLNKWYLIALGVSRLTRIGFWVTMSSRLMTFWFLIAADTIHSLMVVAFAVIYFRVRVKTNKESVLTFSGKDA